MTKPHTFFFPFFSQFVKGLIVEILAYLAKMIHFMDELYSKSFCELNHMAFKFDYKDKQKASEQSIRNQQKRPPFNDFNTKINYNTS